VAFAEFIAENFHSMANLTWDVAAGKSLAHFTIEDVHIEVQFEQRTPDEWLVSFTTRKPPSEQGDYHRAFYIFNGVFQAAEEFIAVRDPKCLVFATKRDELAHIYETYLNRERERIEALGYRVLDPVRIDPYTEYVLERVKPSSWRA
jgi:hypothetical protein